MHFSLLPVRRRLAKPSRTIRARSEQLEGRVLMSTNAWKAAVSGDWDDATKWSLGHVPLSAEDATVTLSGNYTVTHLKTTADSAKSLTIAAAVELDAGSVAISGATLIKSGKLTLKGGTLMKGTLSLSGSGQFVTTTSAGNLDGVTIASNLSLGSYTVLGLRDAITFINSAKLSIGTAHVYMQDETTGPASLAGTGTVSLAGGQLTADNSHGHSPTVGAGILLDGYGTATFTGGVNSGILRADVAGKTLSLAGTITNKYIVGAYNGATLDIAGSGFINSDILASSAGDVVISGAFKCGTGTLLIGIGGTGQVTTYGLINVQGTITLGGSFVVALIDGFTPAGGSSFVPLEYTSKSGSFASSSLTSGSVTFMAAYSSTALTLSIPKITSKIVLTVSYTTLQIATNSAFTSGLQTLTLNGSGSNQISLKVGEYFRFGMSAVVTNNPNPVFNDAWDKANQKAGNPAQSANLGLEVFGISLLTPGNSTAVVAPVSKGGLSTAVVGPTNEPPLAISTPGDVSGGAVGLRSPLGAGWLPADPETLAGVEQDAAYTTPNTLFSNLAYQVTGKGTTSITPELDVGGFSIVTATSLGTVSGKGSPLAPPTYQSTLITPAQMAAPPALTITVS